MNAFQRSFGNAQRARQRRHQIERRAFQSNLPFIVRRWGTSSMNAMVAANRQTMSNMHKHSMPSSDL